MATRDPTTPTGREHASRPTPSFNLAARAAIFYTRHPPWRRRVAIPSTPASPSSIAIAWRHMHTWIEQRWISACTTIARGIHLLTGGLLLRRLQRPAAASEAQSNLQPSRPTLATLPPELLMEIACFLDNRSFLALALAWRPFHESFARSLHADSEPRRRLHALLSGVNTRMSASAATGNTASAASGSSAIAASGNSDARADMRARLYDKVMHWLYGGRQLHDLFNVLVVFERTGEIFLRAGSGLKLRLVDMLQALHDVRHADSYRATLLGSEVIRVDDAYALSMLVRAWDNDPVARALMKDLRFGYVHQPRRRAPVTGWQTNVTQALAHPDFPLVALAVNHLNLATDDSLHMLEIMAKCNKLEDFQFHYRSRVLSDERLEALIHTVSGKPRLYRLALSVEGKLGMQAMQRLLHCTPSLRILEFSADEVYHTATFRHLLEALAENTHVQELRFTEGAITQVHMPAVAAILRRNSTLQQLSICNSPIGDDGLLLMAEALTAHASTRLRGLHLNNVDCTYAGAAALLPMLAVRRCIENVSLDRNFITDDGRLAMERSVEELRHATGRRGRGRRELVVSCENQHELRVLWARTAAARVEDHGDTESEVSN